MAYICYKPPGSCATCPLFRYDEDKMRKCCFAKSDEKNSGKNPRPRDKIRIIKMDGEPQYTGKTGRVNYIDDAGQIHGTWGGCALCTNYGDEFEIIEERK